MRHTGPKFLFFLGIMTLTAVFATSAFAGQGGGYTLKNIIVDQGGVIGMLIIVLSVVMLALVIEHFVSIKREIIIPPDLLYELENLLEEENFEEAQELCSADQSPLGKVMHAALQRLPNGYDHMSASASDAANEQIMYLNQKIGWLSLIAAVAPMFGLLGTVLGMIQAFYQLAASTTVQPAQLADSIGGALVTTLFGLIVAIPTMAFFTFFRNRVQKLSVEVLTVVTELTDRFRETAEAE